MRDFLPMRCRFLASAAVAWLNDAFRFRRRRRSRFPAPPASHAASGAHVTGDSSSAHAGGLRSRCLPRPLSYHRLFHISVCPNFSIAGHTSPAFAGTDMPPRRFFAIKIGIQAADGRDTLPFFIAAMAFISDDSRRPLARMPSSRRHLRLR